jgi:hypothetical protein
MTNILVERLSTILCSQMKAVTYKDVLMSMKQVMINPPAQSASKTKIKVRPDKQSFSKSNKQVTFDSEAPRSVKESRFTSNVNSVNIQHVLNQNQGKKVNPNWVLLDNQSTVDMFYNRKLLVNIRESNLHMNIGCKDWLVHDNEM